MASILDNFKDNEPFPEVNTLTTEELIGIAFEVKYSGHVDLQHRDDLVDIIEHLAARLKADEEYISGLNSRRRSQLECPRCKRDAAGARPTLHVIDLLRSLADGQREAGHTAAADIIEQGADHIDDLADKLTATEDERDKLAARLQALEKPYSTLLRLARILDTTPHHLLGWTERKAPTDGHQDLPQA